MNRCQFSHNLLKIASNVNRKEGLQKTGHQSIKKVSSKLRTSLLPGNTGKQVAGVILVFSPPVSKWISITEQSFLFSTGCGEKMNGIQVISLTLLCVLAANAQVIMPGRCPKPAVQENFDAARVNTKQNISPTNEALQGDSLSR